MRDVRGRLPTPHSVIVDWALFRDAVPYACHESKDFSVHFGPTAILESEDEQSPSSNSTCFKASRAKKRRNACQMDTNSQLALMLQAQNHENEAGLDANFLKKPRDRVPTPFPQNLPANPFGVHFNDVACVEGGHQVGSSLEAPNSSRCSCRRPTPFEFSQPLPMGVRFGLTSELGNDMEDGAPEMRRCERLTTPTLAPAAALPSEALTERAPTPRSSHVLPENFSFEDPEHIPVDRKAFEDKLPLRQCSATEECAVCHEGFGVEEAKLFPCGHFFHADCILQWLERQLTCPLCRRSFAPEIGDASHNFAFEQLDATQPTSQRAWTF